MSNHDEEDDDDILDGYQLIVYLHRGSVRGNGRIVWDEESKKIDETEVWDREELEAKIKEINPGAMVRELNAGPAFRIEVVVLETMDGSIMGGPEHFQFAPERTDDVGNWLPWRRDLAAAWDENREFACSHIRFDREETSRLRELRGRNLQNEITKILAEYRDEVEPLCNQLIDPTTRYTLDEGSLSFEDTELVDERKGFVSGTFTASMYGGCRDIDDIADDREFKFELVINLARTAATISCEIIDYAPEPNEF